jgi:hypothetical protein
VGFDVLTAVTVKNMVLTDVGDTLQAGTNILQEPATYIFNVEK